MKDGMGRHRKTYERGAWIDEERSSSTVLGSKIRSLRQRLSLTLDDAATSAGLRDHRWRP
jgi:hypothetical protein